MAENIKGLVLTQATEHSRLFNEADMHSQEIVTYDIKGNQKLQKFSSIRDFDVVKEMQGNKKVLESLMFDAATVITSQAENVLHKDRVNYVTLEEDSHKYYRIETGVVNSPMKLEFNYTRNSELEDLKMIYSREIEQPLANNCEKLIESPSTVTIKAANRGREFDNERIYIKLESTFGCHVTIKASFPNQNK